MGPALNGKAETRMREEQEKLQEWETMTLDVLQHAKLERAYRLRTKQQ